MKDNEGPLMQHMHPALRALFWFVVVQLVLRFVLHTMLFHPRPVNTRAVREHHAERVTYAADDGPELVGYWVPAVGRRERTVVCFHGNAESASDNAAWGAALAAQGSDVLLAEYRGYGESTGSPSARGIERDADAAIRYLTEIRHVPIGEVIVMSRSLGGAAAIHVLAGSAREARAGVIHSSFTSLHDLATNMLGIPLTRLIPDGWALDSASKAARIRAPILHAHGTADRVIPYRIGQALDAAFPANAGSRFITEEGGDHGTFDRNTYDAIEAFIRGTR
jgi:fermentation-respiration switch protein FrsA (DUF1100 family)